MESIQNDPELGQEIVHLLYNKLQRKRQELEELRKKSTAEVVLVDSSAIQEENEKLRSELSSLHLTLSAALDGQDTKGASRAGSVVDKSLQTLKDREAVQSETIHNMETKLEDYKERYKKLKGEIVTVTDELSPLAAQLQTKTEELEHMRQEVFSANAELKVARRQQAQTFNVHSFLTEDQGDPQLPKATQLEPFLSSQPFLGLPKSMKKKFQSVSLLILRPDDMVWFKQNIDRGFQLVPSFHYDATARNGDGGWIRNQLQQEGSRPREIVYQWKNCWYYYGTYQRVGYTAIEEKEATEINAKAAKKAMNATFLNRNQAAPIVVNFVTELYSTGPLTLELIGWKRTGFNRILFDALLAHRKELQRPSLCKKKANKNSNKGSKRAHGDDDASIEPRNKKQKTS